jgi:hypothetical protein
MLLPPVAWTMVTRDTVVAADHLTETYPVEPLGAVVGAI